MIAIVILIACSIALLFYFLPSFIGFTRKTPNAVPLFLVNLLLGWSGVGWFACLLWAIIEQPRGQGAMHQTYIPTGGFAAGPPALAPPASALAAFGDQPVWYYTDGVTSWGPHSAAEMTAFANAGKLRPDTLCWKPAFGDRWRPLRDLYA